MAINLIDWRAQRQQHLIQQWVVCNALAIASTLALWIVFQPHHHAHCPMATTSISTALPQPMHTAPVTNTWHWAKHLATLIQHWPTTYQLDTLSWQPQGTTLKGRCHQHCKLQSLLSFCQQNHYQLRRLQWHHTSYQFDLYHAHSLPLP